MTPVEVAHRFKSEAESAGAHDRFLEAVTEPAGAVKNSPGYPRLVAALYAMSRPQAQRALAAAGCAQELAAHQ
jgi:hypothetical protein